LRELLLGGGARLVVLTGAGGSGKTSLALEAARQVGEYFANGAALVELAPIGDPALVLPTIARSVGVEDLSPEPLEALAAGLHPREQLLVVDNAEHLPAAARVLAELLARAPHLTMLVTSRAVLRLSRERVYRVEPLGEQAAVALFGERALEADAGFRPGPGDEQAIAGICRRLDGLPLAIELAASTVRMLTPRELLGRLEPRLPLLTGGPQDLPARQRTLQATLDWSYDLLDEEQQRGLRRLAVFAGGFTLEAAERVCGITFERLSALVDHNLVRHVTTGGGSRYTMLETVREYATDRLSAVPEVEETRRRHAEYFLALAQTANLDTGTLAGAQRLQVAVTEQDNLRAALGWAIASGSVAFGLELAAAMDQLWTNDPAEAIRWLAALLEHPQARSAALGLRARALRIYGAAADIACRDELAEQLYQQSLALFEQAGDEQGRAVLLHRLGIQAMRRGQLGRARELVTAAHRIHEHKNDRWGLTQTIGTFGAIARDAGDGTGAYALIQQSAELAGQIRVPWWQGGMLAELALLSLSAGRVAEAGTHARAALAIADELADRPGGVFGIAILACVAAESGQAERAGRLWAAVEDEQAGAPLGGWRRHRDACAARIRAADGPDFRRGRAEGHSLPLDDVITFALHGADRSPART
jgi:predicted ATPase